MTLTLKSKRMQLTEAKSKRLKLFNDVDCAADSRSELASGSIYASRKPPKITVAEQRVLTLLTQARSNKEIASALRISPATVKRHVEKILTKLELRNRVEAAIYGLMIKGCPHESSPGCVFQILQAGSEDTALL